jgi:hypothetical protein
MQVHDLNERPAQPANTPAQAALPVRAFLSGRPDDLVVDLLAYALYARDREARGPSDPGAQSDEDPVLRYRREAGADLSTFAYRFFHNQVEEIRLAAVREHLGALPRPPGFFRLVLASVVGVAGVGAAALWAMGQGGLLAEMAARAAAAARSFGI